MKYLISTILFLVFAAFACTNSSTPENSNANTAQLIQGEWQSLDDSKSLMEIKGNQLSQVYDGKLLEARSFEYAAKCEGNACGAASDNKLGCYSSSGTHDIECYAIVALTDTSLEVSLVGATGNTLTYKKLQPGSIAKAIELAADAINIEVPAEFLVEFNENGEVKVLGQAINPSDFEKIVTEHFEGYRAMGAKTMPPYKSKTIGTVTMGIRGEFETLYNELKEKFENLH